MPIVDTDTELLYMSDIIVLTLTERRTTLKRIVLSVRPESSLLYVSGTIPPQKELIMGYKQFLYGM
jgi:hypothetical protein